MTISSNEYLSLGQMTINAEYIMGYLLDRGWTKESIAGMLGNMQTESTINPGLWQNRDQGNTALGLGLVQWTPATKLISWAQQRSLNYTAIDTQLMFILWEVENNVQWIHPTMSFAQFTQLNTSPEQCAELFIRHYERPANPNQPIRQTQARYWFDNLSGEGGGGTGGGKPAFPTTEGLQITSTYGWRDFNGGSYHWAIDIGGGGRTHPIYATQTGEVITNQWSDSAGWMVTIKHTADPYYSRYIHLDVQSPIPIGRMVSKGEEIGTMGNTGASFGIHLDFAISINGTFGTEQDTIDPELYLQMDFGGGDGGDGEGGKKNKTTDIIHLLLSGAVNGWSY